MYKFKFIAMFSLLLFISCNYGGKDKIPSTPINNKHYMTQLIQKSLKGDKNAYNKLSMYCMLDNRYHEIMYESIVIANKFSDSNAYFLVYWCFIHPNPEINEEPKKQLLKLDKKTRYMTLFYLLKAKELGLDNAKYISEDIFQDTKKVPFSWDYLDSIKDLDKSNNNEWNEK